MILTYTLITLTNEKYVKNVPNYLARHNEKHSPTIESTPSNVNHIQNIYLFNYLHTINLYTYLILYNSNLINLFNSNLFTECQLFTIIQLSKSSQNTRRRKLHIKNLTKLYEETGSASGGQLTDCLHQMSSYVQYILFPCC